MYKWFSSASWQTANVEGAGKDKSEKLFCGICFQLLMCLVKSAAGPEDFNGVSDFSQRSAVCIPAGCMQVVLDPANQGRRKGCEPQVRGVCGAGGRPQPLPGSPLSDSSGGDSCELTGCPGVVV